MMVLICGLLATWLAAGSMGWLAPPLQKSLTWLALGAIVMFALRNGSSTAGTEGKERPWIERGRWPLIAAAVVVAIVMTASPLAAVNILAVSVLLAIVASTSPSAIARVAAPAALAAAVLAVFRLMVEGTASGWTLADAIGRAEGQWAAALTGRPLVIGASFGGIDFLVVMAALAVAWHQTAPRKTARRAVGAAVAITAAQTVYLVVLAFTHDLTDMLPPLSRPIMNEMSHLGVWTWSNAVHAMLPWRLPVLAAILQTAVAVAMFRWIPWPAESDLAIETNTETAASHRRERRITGNPAATDAAVDRQTVWLRFAPAGLLVFAVAAVGLAPIKPDLTGRRIVAYDDGSLNWTTADPGNAPPASPLRFGLLPALVSSLGGEFAISKDLSDGDLRGASVLIVLPPGLPSKPGAAGGPMPDDICRKIRDFVAAGGGLVVAGEPETRLGAGDNALNALLTPANMSFRDDTADSLTERWECNLQASPRAATATSRPGRNCFSIERAASLNVSWPAAPLVVGRWCWNELGSDPLRTEALSYSPGSRLGDLVLAAERNVGRGTVVALGDATCLSNDGIPFSYTFCGPLLAALAEKATSPLAWWRQVLALATAAAAVVLLFHRFDALRLAATAIALALAAIGCDMLNDATSQLLPASARSTGLNRNGDSATRPIIYVDGSHLEATGKDPWRDDGLGRFMRVLAESGYLPLLAPDLSAGRLAGARMLISIAPGQKFGEAEVAEVKSFVEQGGTFLSMAGSTDAAPSEALLDELKLSVPPMPVPPWKNVPETEPLGALASDFTVPKDIATFPSGENQMVRFHAAWPVAAAAGASNWPANSPRGPVIAGNRIGKGQAFVLGDSQFALRKSFVLPPGATADMQLPQNAAFWQTTLRSWLKRPTD